ncbi:MAG: competence/damage-inducible protein A [Sedimentisphaerales bacterium]
MQNNAAIISVGNELLNGNTVDTNSNWLCGRLLSVSIPVVYSCAVGDDTEEIKNAIQYASGKADIILITGGLGPTDDDLTRDGIAKFLSVELEYHPEISEKIKKFFAVRNYPMAEKNKIQAYLPAGTSEIENGLGTAPGIFYEDDKKIIASFPGVPSEMKQMFDKSILPKLKKFAQGDILVVRKIRCIGAGESAIAQMLGDSMKRDRNPLINCTVDCGIITLHIIARTKDKDKAADLAQEDIQKLRGILGKLIYGLDEQTLAEVVGQKLAEKKKTLAVAESCTGGLIAKMITDVPGSSRYFTYGWVTYSNESKVSELGVKKELIEKFGAVSSEVAQAMAVGAKQKSGSDFAIAVTGIAGPDGGSEQKPVGLVYISIASPDGINTEKFLFGPRNRDFIRLRASQTLLNLLRLKLDI